MPVKYLLKFQQIYTYSHPHGAIASTQHSKTFNSLHSQWSCFLYLTIGSISDVELTKTCGFIEELEGKTGISIMADCNFTTKDQLTRIGIKLNIPPFLDG